MVQEQAPPKAPLRSLGRNETNGSSSFSLSSQGPDKPHTYTGGGITFANPSTSSRANAAPQPDYKSTAFSGANMEDKYSNLFIQPKNRPEHHRPHRITGPLQPTFKDKRAAPPPTFDTIPASTGSASNPISISDGPPVSIYTQPGVFSEYVPPKEANDDLKALLEGSIEDDEDKLAQDEVEAKSQIPGLKVRLLPHQVEGVEWMKGRELGPVKRGAKVPKGGLLADDMGLGKTLQSISLILTNTKPDGKHPGVEKTTLVVAPLALIRQWEAELTEKISASHRLRVLVHHGPQRTKRFEDLRRYDVVITTYQILVSEHGHSNQTLKAGCFGLHWYRVILDEAHTIKNRNAKATKACCELRSVYRWCLSGTPMQNNLDELQSLVKFLRIRPYDDLKEWKDHFDTPIKNGKGHIAIRRLHSLLNVFMKRRTKEILKEVGALSTGLSDAKDGEEGKSAVPQFKVTERKVIPMTAKLSPAERRFYDRLERRTDKSITEMMRGKVNYASALVLLLRLRQACNHPKLVEGKIEKDKDAISEEARPKTNDTDVDALADLLGGLDVEVKHCDICGWTLDKDIRQPGTDKCKACYEDLQYFKHHEDGDDFKPSKPKKKKKKSKHVFDKSKILEIRQKATEEASSPEVVQKRRPRNRRAIIDSEDEEAEGSWIVSGDEQGPLRLGKAGGRDDENAEGEGEMINSEDSEEEESQNGSRLDSFVVDDGQDSRPSDIRRALVEESDDDDLESLSGIPAKIERRQSQASAAKGGETEPDSEAESEEEGTYVSESELDTSQSDSDDEQYGVGKGPAGWRRNLPKERTPHVLASAKVRQLITILQEEVHEHKFIVFSQFTSMLNLIEPFFRKEGIKFARYDGSMKNDMREAALDSLRKDRHTRVLLCSLRCGSLGLNLTAASRVVILEPFWNPFVEEQAIDRVHRLTQTVDVVVYKLTIENSVEERILELQTKKRLLAEQAIEGAATGSRRNGKKEGLKLGLKEMLELFRHHDDGDGRTTTAMRLTNGEDARTFIEGVGNLRSNNSRRDEGGIYGRRW